MVPSFTRGTTLNTSAQDFRWDLLGCLRHLQSRRCDPHARYFRPRCFELCAVGEWAHVAIRMLRKR